MKDAYSFDLDADSARVAYNKMFVSYLKTFARMGLTAIPMEADTGPIGGDMSHEFIILAELVRAAFISTRIGFERILLLTSIMVLTCSRLFINSHQFMAGR